VPVAGSLYGLAYGDALGKETEFLTVPEIEQRYGPGGPVDLPEPALVTDDTQMALAVGEALLAAPAYRPEVLEPLLRKHFVDWAGSPENNRAPGMTCLRAVGGLAEGVRWQLASVVGSKGCGANMRVTPVGLVPDLPLVTLAGVAQFQAALTHGHPTALAASELTGYATRALRDGVPLVEVPGLLHERCASQRYVYHEEWLGDLWQVAGAGSPVAFIATGWDECRAALDRLVAALAAPDRAADPCLATGAGWIAEEALVTALYCALLYPDDPVAALRRAACSSGDSDSIACLAGALHGAVYGLGCWPPEWQARIEYADRLATLATAWTV
jgi:ADP-ribosylglycohydrolase